VTANVSGAGNNNRRLFLMVGLGCAALALVCIVIVGLLVVIGGGTVFGVLSVTQPAADAGESFMTALKNGNYADAYALCSPALQRSLVNTQGLQRMVQSGKAQPTQWSFNSRKIDSDVATLTGDATLTSGAGTVRLTLVKVGDAWKIDAFSLNPK
jgi:hypothetical protein